MASKRLLLVYTFLAHSWTDSLVSNSQHTYTHENMRIIFSFWYNVVGTYNSYVHSAVYNVWIYANRHNTIWISYEYIHTLISFVTLYYLQRIFAHVCARYARIKLTRYVYNMWTDCWRREGCQITELHQAQTNRDTHYLFCLIIT